LYEDAQTVVRTAEADSKAFDVKLGVGLHEGSTLFVIVREVITKEL